MNTVLFTPLVIRQTAWAAFHNQANLVIFTDTFTHNDCAPLNVSAQTWVLTIIILNICWLFVVHENPPLCNHSNCANRATRTRYFEQLSHEYGSIIRYEWLMIYFQREGKLMWFCRGIYAFNVYGLANCYYIICKKTYRMEGKDKKYRFYVVSSYVVLGGHLLLGILSWMRHAGILTV